jgi:predicted DNA-binding transcriptional regulator YafY
MISSSERILELYQIFSRGEKVSIEQASLEYGKHPETIKEDIKHLRNAFSSLYKTIHYNRKEKVYQLEQEAQGLQGYEGYLILLLLYSSRSFSKREQQLLEARVLDLFPSGAKRQLKKQIESFTYSYTAHQENELLLLFEMLYDALVNQYAVEIYYLKKGHSTIRRIVEPQYLSYHDGAFYLTAKRLEPSYEQPANYRVDRIQQLTVLKRKFSKKKEPLEIKDGEHSSLSIEKFLGPRLHVKLLVKEWVEEHVYRTFPRANRTGMQEDWIEMEVEVFGDEGILFWILSQRNWVKVMKPDSLRSKVQSTIHSMTKLYDEKEGKEG